ncbi:MAG: hypothetical protein JXR46_01240 [Calditrichaceae bacterium]|nr:hypothetical protein [Calditrichaceae bacterium]MBN2707641.1 hypothetical protein [Calditrichaceae bacterium]RQV93189.1 MAG: hypothetical protein EH224_12895 [Calditrichota bacterium]
MQSDFGVVAVLLVIFGSFVLVIKHLLNTSTWKKLIEKNLLSDNAKLPVLPTAAMDRLSWAKWGIVLIAFGAALLILEIIPYRMSDALIIGVTSIFVGAAFIVSYFISARQTNKEE